MEDQVQTIFFKYVKFSKKFGFYQLNFPKFILCTSMMAQ